MTPESKTAIPTEIRREYDALRRAAALLDGGGRTLIGVRGERAQEMVGGLVTNHVAGLSPGRACYAFLLTPKGRPVAELRVLVLEEEIWLDLPEACRPGTLAHLKKYLPPIYAEFAPIAHWRRLSVVGPRSAGVVEAIAPETSPPDLEPLGIASLDSGRAAEEGPDDFLVRREEIEGPGYDLYLRTDGRDEPRTRLERAVIARGGRSAGPEAYEIWRIERGIPVYGPEISQDVLPQETGQQGRAVNFEKGCYTGQEVVARIHYRGKVNRRLMGLRFDGFSGEEMPGPGRELYAGGRARATVTSSTLSPRFGPVALGFVRRELSAGDRLSLTPGGAPACAVVKLPFGQPPEMAPAGE